MRHKRADTFNVAIGARTHTYKHTLKAMPHFQSVKYLALQAVLVNTVLMTVINETCSLAGTLISKSLTQTWQGTTNRLQSHRAHRDEHTQKQRKQL